MFRPLLTEEHKQARIQYINEIRTLTDQGATIGFEDEAWKYLWSRRKKMKHLPRAPFEEQGADRVQVRRVISRNNPIKTMFMGVVFPPNPEQNFDGKVTIKRVSRTRQLLRDTYRCTKFHNDYHVNQLLIAGDWRQVYDDETYPLSLASRLSLSLQTALVQQVFFPPVENRSSCTYRSPYVMRFSHAWNFCREGRILSFRSSVFFVSLSL